MQLETMIVLRTDLAAAVIAAHRNPNDWNAALRGVAERLGLNLARIDFHTSLLLTASSIVEEASQKGRTPEAIRAAIELVTVEANRATTEKRSAKEQQLARLFPGMVVDLPDDEASPR